MDYLSMDQNKTDKAGLLLLKITSHKAIFFTYSTTHTLNVQKHFLIFFENCNETSRDK